MNYIASNVVFDWLNSYHYISMPGWGILMCVPALGLLCILVKAFVDIIFGGGY